MKRRLIIAGKRDADRTEAARLLRQGFTELGIRDEDIEAIGTGESGVVDLLGKQYAKAKGIPYEPFPANWNVVGPAAGPLRNAEMAAWANEVPGSWLVAVWDGRSRGTRDMIQQARKRGLVVNVQYLGLQFPDGRSR